MNELTIERIKSKGGKYNYFVANNDGEKIKTILEKYVDGKELFNGFWQFKYEDTTPTYTEQEKYIGNVGDGEEDFIEVDVEYGGIDVELICIFNNFGDVIFSGIIEIISWNEDYDYFLLELHKDFNKEIINKAVKSGRLFNNEKKIYCLVDGAGEMEIEPTHNRIYFNSEENRYEERK